MAKKTKDAGAPRPPGLPRDRLEKVSLGKSFAEYDPLLRDGEVFVVTPAIDGASSSERIKTFFVGRRGTGKTAITLYLQRRKKRTFIVVPQQFVPTNSALSDADYRDTRQRPFRSLKEAFTRAFITEAVKNWLGKGLLGREGLPDEFRRHLNMIEDFDFDARLLSYAESCTKPLVDTNDKEWLKQIKVGSTLVDALNYHFGDVTNETLLLVDRIDDAWDGTDRAVIFLMAMMHACVELSAKTSIVRPVLFLRENIFERVRQIDNEFGRLETSVVSLDWTPELLREFIERRLNKPFIKKLKLHGETWDAFFGAFDGESSFHHVADFCQHRPRDVLTYCSLALERAVARRHEMVAADDFLDARAAFSASRLKDLSDEYAENYPNIGVILERFYGLGNTYTFAGIASLHDRLLMDDAVKLACGQWLYGFNQIEKFIELLYGIGFLGIGNEVDRLEFRPSGISQASGIRITTKTICGIHRSYWDALKLHNETINKINEDVSLKSSGIVVELPNGVTLSDYQARLQSIQDDLRTLPTGLTDASRFEDIVGDVLKMCFYRNLVNPEPKLYTSGRVQCRDWIVSNTAITGFWEQMRARYKALQVVVECKNYEDIGADEFQQAAYYLQPNVTGLVIIAFRGDEVKPSHIRHIEKISRDKQNSLVLLWRQRDLLTFLRQAANGKSHDSHLQELFEHIIRKIN